MEDKLELFASEVARLAVKFAGPSNGGEWVPSITLPRGFLSREIVEGVEIVLGLRRVEVPGELIRININVPDGIETGARLRRLICQKLPPIIEGIGNFRAEDTAQGLVLLLVDDRDIDGWPLRLPVQRINQYLRRSPDFG